eukprot:GDKJ01012966.1.p1 GENE.GDKJ01012966.1~~GDKJ01012966.1.p1  ORF type:complete len:1545 (+),score=481.53 GDKJ01012966.1:586-4635(+)
MTTSKPKNVLRVSTNVNNNPQNGKFVPSDKATKTVSNTTETPTPVSENDSKNNPPAPKKSPLLAPVRVSKSFPLPTSPPSPLITSHEIPPAVSNSSVFLSALSTYLPTAENREVRTELLKLLKNLLALQETHLPCLPPIPKSLPFPETSAEDFLDLPLAVRSDVAEKWPQFVGSLLRTLPEWLNGIPRAHVPHRDTTGYLTTAKLSSFYLPLFVPLNRSSKSPFERLKQTKLSFTFPPNIDSLVASRLLLSITCHCHPLHASHPSTISSPLQTCSCQLQNSFPSENPPISEAANRSLAPPVPSMSPVSIPVSIFAENLIFQEQHFGTSPAPSDKARIGNLEVATDVFSSNRLGTELYPHFPPKAEVQIAIPSLANPSRLVWVDGVLSKLSKPSHHPSLPLYKQMRHQVTVSNSSLPPIPVSLSLYVPPCVPIRQPDLHNFRIKPQMIKTPPEIRADYQLPPPVHPGSCVLVSLDPPVLSNKTTFASTQSTLNHEEFADCVVLGTLEHYLSSTTVPVHTARALLHTPSSMSRLPTTPYPFEKFPSLYHNVFDAVEDARPLLVVEALDAPVGHPFVIRATSVVAEFPYRLLPMESGDVESATPFETQQVKGHGKKKEKNAELSGFLPFPLFSRWAVCIRGAFLSETKFDMILQTKNLEAKVVVGKNPRDQVSPHEDAQRAFDTYIKNSRSRHLSRGENLEIPRVEEIEDRVLSEEGSVMTATCAFCLRREYLPQPDDREVLEEFTESSPFCPKAVRDVGVPPSSENEHSGFDPLSGMVLCDATGCGLGGHKGCCIRAGWSFYPLHRQRQDKADPANKQSSKKKRHPLEAMQENVDPCASLGEEDKWWCPACETAVPTWWSQPLTISNLTKLPANVNDAWQIFACMYFPSYVDCLRSRSVHSLMKSFHRALYTKDAELFHERRQQDDFSRSTAIRSSEEHAAVLEKYEDEAMQMWIAGGKWDADHIRWKSCRWVAEVRSRLAGRVSVWDEPCKALSAANSSKAPPPPSNTVKPPSAGLVTDRRRAQVSSSNEEAHQNSTEMILKDVTTMEEEDNNTEEKKSSEEVDEEEEELKPIKRPRVAARHAHVSPSSSHVSSTSKQTAKKDANSCSSLSVSLDEHSEEEEGGEEAGGQDQNKEERKYEEEDDDDDEGGGDEEEEGNASSNNIVRAKRRKAAPLMPKLSSSKSSKSSSSKSSKSSSKSSSSKNSPPSKSKAPQTLSVAALTVSSSFPSTSTDVDHSEHVTKPNFNGSTGLSPSKMKFLVAQSPPPSSAHVSLQVEQFAVSSPIETSNISPSLQTSGTPPPTTLPPANPLGSPLHDVLLPVEDFDPNQPPNTRASSPAAFDSDSDGLEED